jgi:hypothetical protein
MPEEVKARTVLINKIFLKNSCTTEWNFSENLPNKEPLP